MASTAMARWQSRSYESLQDTDSDSPLYLAASGHQRSKRRYAWLLAAALQLILLPLAVVGAVLLLKIRYGELVPYKKASPDVLRQVGWDRQPLNLDPTAAPSAPLMTAADGQLTVHTFAARPAAAVSDLHLLILTPFSSSADQLPRFFSILDSLSHPKVNTSLGFLVGNEHDSTASDLYDFAVSNRSAYKHITLLRRDLDMLLPTGAARHSIGSQPDRRSLLAKTRNFLVTACLEPTVDWVLWLDSDVVDVPPDLIADLLQYGTFSSRNLSAGNVQASADVITPNIMRRGTALSAHRLKGYDLNNWSENEQSRKNKLTLADDDVLLEGYQRSIKTYRDHLVDQYVPSNYTEAPDFLVHERPPVQTPVDRFDADSPAFVGKQVALDAVGGVATLVRATTHRMGALFPSWTEDHQLETEGFGVMARKVGARIIGLPNYAVVHA